MSSINQSDELIAYNLIDYINDSGYLTESLENIFILLKFLLGMMGSRYSSAKEKVKASIGSIAGFNPWALLCQDHP